MSVCLLYRGDVVPKVTDLEDYIHVGMNIKSSDVSKMCDLICAPYIDFKKIQKLNG